MELGLWFQPTTDAATIARRVRVAEEAGCDFAGVTDGQMIWRDVYVCLTLASQATSRIRMGPWVTNPITRHVTATANAVCTLHELSGGRMFVGIGVGDDSVRTIGRRPARLGELATVVDRLRGLMSGETVVDDEGHEWSLSTGRMPPPPIYWAAAGPLSLRRAGALTDGAIHSGWLVPELMEEDLGEVAAGAEEAGRDPGEVATIFNTAVAVHEDREQALDWVAPYAARAFLYPSSTRVPEWSEDDRMALMERYDYYGHFRPEQAATAPRALIDRKAVAGDPDDVVALLERVARAGYTHVALTPMGDVDAVTRALADEVFPRVRSGTAGGRGVA